MERKCKKLVKDARSTLKLDQNAVAEIVEADGGELALSAKQESKTHSGSAGGNNTA